MESKFTPGPWEAVFPNDRPPYIAADSRDTVIVSLPYWKDEFQEELKANARLIAAAPEMHARIAALEAALRNLISAVEAARNADDAVCWTPSDEVHAAREDAHASLIICENEARTLIAQQEEK